MHRLSLQNQVKSYKNPQYQEESLEHQQHHKLCLKTMIISVTINIITITIMTTTVPKFMLGVTIGISKQNCN